MTKRVISMALALMLVLACFAGVTVSAEEKEYGLFIAYGGDKVGDTSWANSYWGSGDAPAGMTVVNGTIKEGETVTVSINFAEATGTTWVVAPCLTGNGIGNALAIDFDIICKIDGQEVAIDMNADSEGRTWWAEGTGDFAGTECVRLAGTYNEWGQKFISVPASITSIEYTVTLNDVRFEGEEPEAPSYEMFICYGGDKTSENDWGYEYWGTERYNSEGITWQNASVKVGETATISLTFDTPTVNTWCVSPCLLVDDTSLVSNVEFDISCKINGEEVAIDLTAGDAWWAEDTDTFKSDKCLRLAGGYNEWGTKYIAEPAPITTIEYTITLKAVEFAEPEAPVVGAQEEFELFVAYGGDKVSENDWGYEYWGTERYNSEGITWQNATVKIGETATISLTFDTPTVNTWCLSPCMLVNDSSAIANVEFDISCKINGEEVAIDLAAGDAWWAEDTDTFKADKCLRLAGGYNEWGTKYIAEPAPITSIEYTITLKSVTYVSDGPAFDLFIAYGGDRAESNDWGYEYYGADTEKSAGITAVKETISVGQTKTISLTFDNAAVYSWFFSPCLVADDVTWIGELDFDITCKVNGQEVDINMAADSQGRTWWTEGTGDYTGAQCIRLAGGYNEWGAQFISQPEGLTTIEYTITLNGVKEAPPAGAGVESTEEYYLFIAYQGDKAAENDWGWGYFGKDVEGVTATTATIKSGDTATISLTFDSATVNSWWFCPVLVGTGAGDQICLIDFDLTCKIDGVEVPVNWEADAEGRTWWAEGTDSYVKEDCIRLGGGYNEWATKYVDEPGAFSTIEYTITFNSIQLRTEEEEEPAVEIDPMGTYNAYLMLQTPNWTFRNAYDDAFYGVDGSSWEALGLTWGQYLVHQDHPGETWGKVTDAVIAGNGTYSVSITDFGTVFADDFAAAGQEYFNIIAISTDLPAGANVTITNVELVIDGKVRHTYENAYINEESTGTLQILVQNIWNSDVKELNYYPAPAESLEIRFTISGFGYDKAADPVDPGTDVEPSTPADTKPVETKPAGSEPTPSAPVATEPSGNNTVIIIVIVAVAIVAVVAVVLVSKKKKA